MQHQGADEFRRVDEPGAQIEVNSTVADWDDHVLYDQWIRNYTKKPVEVEIRVGGPPTGSSFPGLSTTVARQTG